ncbi:phage major tail protein, TP901-1 family (plasmid) [Clostridium perfringens]|uniref:phage tail tube protein n=1 Tax=Clostridium perfringens TaxID=1502 RepID=UPI001CCAF29D|nr:phage tail tube protein [Clostridium perfringens]UBK83422.1 phage major tail protein, TP901-1 family [Clostridium perfringens]
MAGKKIAGVDALIEVSDGSGGSIAVGGQKGASLKRKADTIDVSDKNSGGWSESIMGLKSWSVDFDGFVTIGDKGLDLLLKAFDDRTPVSITINVGKTEGYTYTGLGVITDFPEEYASDDAVTYSLTLEGASALTRATKPTGH